MIKKIKDMGNIDRMQQNVSRHILKCVKKYEIVMHMYNCHTLMLNEVNYTIAS